MFDLGQKEAKVNQMTSEKGENIFFRKVLVNTSLCFVFFFFWSYYECKEARSLWATLKLIGVRLRNYVWNLEKPGFETCVLSIYCPHRSAWGLFLKWITNETKRMRAKMVKIREAGTKFRIPDHRRLFLDHLAGV